MTKQHCTDWFHKAKWGLFMHFLAGAADGGANDVSAAAWNRRVDAFDVNGLVTQLQAADAGYFIITIGQNSGHYCAPNHTYDSLTGILPSKCSKRDLIADLGDALAPTGIRLLVYSSSVGPGGDHEARKGLKQYHEWNDADHDADTDWNRYRQIEHMLNWEKVLKEWSQCWGNKISGWWIDGCYHKAERYPETEEPNLKTLANVLRSGNPDSIIAFNPGVRVPVVAYSEHEDYTAGEVAGALPLLGQEPAVLPVERFLDGEQYHILTFLGDYWGRGEPRFNGYLVAGYTEHINRHGGVITWDVPHTENGLITDSAMDMLSLINR